MHRPCRAGAMCTWGRVVDLVCVDVVGCVEVFRCPWAAAGLDIWLAGPPPCEAAELALSSLALVASRAWVMWPARACQHVSISLITYQIISSTSRQILLKLNVFSFLWRFFVQQNRAKLIMERNRHSFLKITREK